MFIGERKVDKIDGTTVSFADGGTKEFTARQLQYVVTEESKDPTAYRELVMENVMPDIRVALKNKDVTKQALKILGVIELHDLTNSEFQKTMSLMTSEVIASYNDLLAKRMAKEQKAIEQHQQLIKMLQESYENILYTATGKAFGTYEEGRHPADFLDNIRVSDLKKAM